MAFAFPVEPAGFVAESLFISGQTRRKRVWPRIAGYGQMSSSRQLALGSEPWIRVTKNTLSASVPV